MTDDATWGGKLWAVADLATPMAVRVAATLRLADHIVAGTRTTEALAATVQADPDALERLLRHLVDAGVLTRDGSGEYGLTSLGEELRSDYPHGIREWIDLEGALGRADLSLVQLLHTVRTGEPGFPLQFGRSFWEDLAADPERSASFDALMGARLSGDAATLATTYPWDELGRVVDVGGGNGSLLIAILRAHPGLRGTVLELPAPAASAREAIAAAGLADRADAQAGSFLDPLPAGAGGYVLTGVLHDWDDQDALRILKRCVEAAGETGRVIVVEEVVGDDAESASGDLRMLSFVRGRDRTFDQLAALGQAAGLEVGEVVPGKPRTIIEMRPAR
jgi:hypothetical protein